jgi:WD40 repeat protein
MARLCWLLLSILCFYDGLTPVHARQAAAVPGFEKLYQTRKKAWEAERAASLKSGLTEADFQTADRLKAQAEEEKSRGTTAQAAKIYREARFAIPFKPSGLPENISRVLGTTRLQHTAPVMGISIHPKLSRIVGGGEDGSVHIWDLENGRQLASYKHTAGSSLCVKWSPNGETIACGLGNDVHILGAEKLNLLHTLKGHTLPVEAMAFSADSKLLITSGQRPDKEIKAWDVGTGKLLGMIAEEKTRIYQIACAPSGKEFATVDMSGNLKLYDFAAKDKWPLKPAQTLQLHTANGAFAVSFAPKELLVYTAGSDKQIKQTPLPGSVPAKKKQITDLGILHSDYVTALAVSPDGRFLASGGKDRVIKIYDLFSMNLIRSFSGHGDTVTGLAFTADSETLVSGSLDQTIRIWDVSLSDANYLLSGQKGILWSCAVSPDGSQVATAGVDRKLTICDLKNNKVLKSFVAHDATVTTLLFSPDGQEILTAGGDKKIKLWEVASGKMIKEYIGHTGPVMALAFDKAGKAILSGSADKTAILWDKNAGNPVATLKSFDSAVSAVDFSPSGKWFAIGTADGNLRLFALANPQKQEYQTSAHQSGLAALQFHPNLPSIATVGGDQLLKFWSIWR